jgi:hypothetical protein
LTVNDPTDTALAVIASILDHQEIHHEAEAVSIVADEPVVADEKPLVPEMVDASGYQKVGPGPMDAIRFKWAVRHEANDEYYVDETIGENSTPIVSGPMTADAAIRFVDDRSSDAHQRFEQFRNEINGRAAAYMMHHDNDEL